MYNCPCYTYIKLQNITWRVSARCTTCLSVLKVHPKSCIYENLSCCFLFALQRKSHLCIPFLGIARPKPQFPHSCVCEPFIYSQDRSTYFLHRQIDQEYRNRSQTLECGNWDCGRVTPFLGIFVSKNFRELVLCSVYVIQTLLCAVIMFRICNGLAMLMPLLRI